MAQTVILLIALILLLALGWLALRKQHGMAAPHTPQPVDSAEAVAALALRTPWRRRGRLHLPRGLFRLLSSLLSSHEAGSAMEILRTDGRSLTLLLLTLRRDLHHAAALPADERGTPRMLLLARELARLNSPCDAESLNAALASWHEVSATTLEERMALPLCLRLALWERLGALLADLRRDLAETHRGRQLAKKLMGSRKPMAQLASCQLSDSCVDALLHTLRHAEHTTLLSALNDHLAQQDITPGEAALRHSRHQAMLAEGLVYAHTALTRLSTVDWPAAEEASDPLHLLFQEDPAAVYPAMTSQSRLDYRRRAASLARLFHADETRLARTVLQLCREAEADGLGNHVGWYLLEHNGAAALRRQLRSRYGGLRLAFRRHAMGVYRSLLLLADVLAAWGLLELGCSLWLLPLPLIPVSVLLRAVLDALFCWLLPALPPPQMQINRVTEDMRTLVVIPAVLHQRAEAVPMVRRLLLARKAFPEGAIDCLLLGDYGDSLTQTAGDDSAITFAARSAIEAIDRPDNRFLYLHRRRVYNKPLHRYTGRADRHGAIECLSRLICEGVCADEFDEASAASAFFHHRYAFVLTLTPEATPAPDMLLPLLGVLLHPLNARRETPEGVRGVSMAQPRLLPDPDSLRTRLTLWHARERRLPWPQLIQRTEAAAVRLFRPEDVLAATDDVLAAADTTHLLLGELAGCIQAEDAVAYLAQPASLAGWLRRAQRQARRVWQLLPWLTPWISPGGSVRRNPLAHGSRFILRSRLWQVLVPPMQLLGLLYAAAASNLPLLLVALLAPELPTLFPMSRHSVMGLVSHAVLLPLRAVVRAAGLAEGVWHILTHQDPALPFQRPESLATLESWSQCVAAIAVAGLSFLRLPPFWPGLALGAVFAFFPLMHTHLDAPLHRRTPITDAADSDLTDMAQATWRYFEETVTEHSRHLPPVSLQVKPYRGPADVADTADIGLYLLSLLAAKELSLISAEVMASRMSATADTLALLPTWHGLPYRRYLLATLLPEAPGYVSAEACGIYGACLRCAAQGLRACLSDVPEALRDLPARLDALAQALDWRSLYDAEASQFYQGVHTDSDTPEGHHSLYASPALLCSYLAVMSRQAPLHHFAALSTVRAAQGREAPLCSPTGSAEDYLLALLMLPAAPGSPMARSVDVLLREEKRRGHEGMFGLSACAVWAFDQQMNYQLRPLGLPEMAMEACSVGPAIVPYACALGLPFDPAAAHESLTRLRSHGMLTHLGFYDSLDLDINRLPDGTEQEPVRTHLSGHQAMVLCGLCNALTAGSLVRTFMAIPEAAAFSSMLRRPEGQRLILPPRLMHPEQAVRREPSFRRDARPYVLPLDAHLIGSPEASLLMSAQGLGVMRCRGVNLTRFTGDPTVVEGIQFYVGDGIHTWRLGDPALEGETVFAEGCIRLIRRFSSLQCTLTAMVDPASGTFLHTLEIANLSASERYVEAADCLIPGFADDTAPCVQAARPSDRVLTLTRRPGRPDTPALTLCHVLTTADPLIALASVTDRVRFQGAGHTLSHPAALDTPLADGFDAAPLLPCAAFRMKLSLGVRGRAMLIFTTRLLRPAEGFSLESMTPRMTDLPGLLTLSRLACRAITDALNAHQAQAALLSRLSGPCLWSGQPHQGAVSPLALPLSALADTGLNLSLPLITVMLYTPDGIPLLREAAEGAAWLTLSGQAVSLCVLCGGDHAETARKAAEAALVNSLIRQQKQAQAMVLLTSDLPDGARDTLAAASRLVLYESAGSLAEQLDGLSVPLPPAVPADPPDEAPALAEEPLRFTGPYGGFQDQTDDYVIRLGHGVRPPLSWGQELYGDRVISRCFDGGLGTTRLGALALSAASTDGLCPMPAEIPYLLEMDTVFTPTPLPLGGDLACRVQHSPGQTTWHTLGHGLDCTLQAAVIPDAPFVLRTLRLKNLTGQERSLKLALACRFSASSGLTYLTEIPGGMAALAPGETKTSWLVMPEGGCTVARRNASAFLGLGNGLPHGIDAPSEDTGDMALLLQPLTLPAGGSAAVTWLLGASPTADGMEQVMRRVLDGGTSAILRLSRQRWASSLSALTVSTPDDAFNLLMNRLLPWQSQLPQSDGWQDFVSLLLQLPARALTDPSQARAALLLCARHQYESGDIQQRWRHREEGLRTRAVGARLLLPLMTARYIALTGDSGVLTEALPYLLDSPGGRAAEGPDAPGLTKERFPLHDHCMRALTSIRLGSHGLPLAGPSAPEDSLTLAPGENVALALLFAQALTAYASCTDGEERADIQAVNERLTAAIHQAGWDGSWYLLSYLPDGRPIGSAQYPEYHLDGVTQAWAVAALGDTERTRQAMASAWQQLYEPTAGLMRCLTPPMESLRVGPASALLPGAGRNGGQDTLSAAWLLEALALLGWHDRAWLLLDGLNPLLRTDDADRYRQPPYLLPASMTAPPQVPGQALSPADAGAAAALYDVILRRLLGLNKLGSQVSFTPHVPPRWDFFSLTLRYGASTWHFHASRDTAALTCDGDRLTTDAVTLTDDGRIHQVRVPIRTAET